MMKMDAWFVALLLLCSQVLFTSAGKFEIKVHNVVTNKDDAYLCANVKLPFKIYPIGFKTNSKMEIAHHILLFACKQPNLSKGHSCMAPCFSREKILYAWARNAEPLRLPKHVSFEIGGDTEYSHLVLQVHYMNPVLEPDNSGVTVYTSPHPLPNVAGVLLMSANGGQIPKHKKAVPIGIGCRLSMEAPITPFAARVHTHSLGRINFAYWFPKGDLHRPRLVVRGSPQWPQAFYPTALQSPMHHGDYIIGFCIYDSMKRYRSTFIGPTHKDEMCNVYIMFSRRREDPELTEFDEQGCSDGISMDLTKFSSLVNHIPRKAFDYLPTKVPHHKKKTKQAAHTEKTQLASHTEKTKQAAHSEKTQLASHTEKTKQAAHTEKTQLASHTEKTKQAAHTEKTKQASHTEKTKQTSHIEKTNSVSPVQMPKPIVHSVGLKIQAHLGQVAGVAVDSHGRLFVFHRGYRKWDANSFDIDERFKDADTRGPIKEATVLVVDRVSGAVLDSFGSGLFFMPHGITIDAADNVWVTDVALHQVFRFDKHKFAEPALIVGTRLQPGRGRKHFCKPTDVAVLPDGHFFVADGYCNARIVAFSPQGRFLRAWGSKSGELQIPHSLALLNDSLLCCADRERARVECFRPSDGASLITVKDLPPLKEELFAICPAAKFSQDGRLALFGVSFRMNGVPQAFLLDLNARSILVNWNLPPGRPHDVASFGSDVLVGQLDEPVGVLRFQVSRPPAVVALPEPSASAELVLTDAPHNVSQLATNPWQTIKTNLPFVLGVVLLVPLGIIALGALIARLHRHRLRSRSRAYKNRERAKFKALINEDESGSEGEMTLMDDSSRFKYGAPRPTPSPRST